MAERSVLPILFVSGGIAESWNKEHPEAKINAGSAAPSGGDGARGAVFSQKNPVIMRERLGAMGIHIPSYSLSNEEHFGATS